ncbi:hypothetical protein K493DRAFT_283954 [Basidiobolus meristosporus CBS 931.73]|uniref:Dilute domain-containing protein n=1 Tax=Basidiobolus meristosporus CBS 931.73 TaxID=1314790 RepID=A0A1Y1Y921_9FUNG|nr:hypothetical protein K493DRAFT_283954 [Basidiobolus meristosporus CBS 931.73]|eukprot:ORX94236.1 hypothetical protein K493DRAFT_283954 [Basidiobolus meristosporus CBS 931.73]
MEVDTDIAYSQRPTYCEGFPKQFSAPSDSSSEPELISCSSSYRLSNNSSLGPRTPDSDRRPDIWGYATEEEFAQAMRFSPPKFDKNGELGIERSFDKLSFSIGRNATRPSDGDDIFSCPTSDNIDLSDPFESEEEILAQTCLTREQKCQKLTHILRRASSNGDSKRVSKLLEIAKDYVDINGQDEDGTTPLIHSACWGYLEVAYALLEAGADPDAQDKSGWTALMWATNNHHDGIVATLVDHGASTASKSTKGRTVLDFANRGSNSDTFQSQRILEILTDPRDGSSSSGSNRESGYYSNPRADLEDVMSESDILFRMALDRAKENDGNTSDFKFSDYGDFEDETEFSWDNIQPDQMFVFTHDNLDFLLDKIITDMKPHYSREYKFLPANILFLAARYGVCLGGLDLLEELMSKSFEKVLETVKQYCQDMSYLAFWLSNCTLLLHYLKRDTNLVTATVEFQLALSELIHELYQRFVRNVTQRIEELLEPAMLAHDALPGMDDIKFVGEKRNFLFQGKKTFTPPPSPRTNRLTIRRKTRFSSPRGTPPRSKPTTPKTITSILSSTLIVLQSYEVHPTIIHYVLNQIFYYMSAEMFNRIIITKEYCCRVKAMQIRMNVSTVEEWVHTNRLPQVLVQHFQPMTQLLQFLQCLSGLSELTELLVTIKELPALNLLQLYRLVSNYRYEVGEKQLPEEISQYLEQVARDTCDLQARSSIEAEQDGHRTPKVREEVIDTLPTHEPGRAGSSLSSGDMEELMDPMHLLPFAIPTSTEMLSGWGKCDKEYVPYLPDAYLEELDNELRVRSEHSFFD